MRNSTITLSLARFNEQVVVRCLPPQAERHDNHGADNIFALWELIREKTRLGDQKIELPINATPAEAGIALATQIHMHFFSQAERDIVENGVEYMQGLNEDLKFDLVPEAVAA